MNNGSGFKLAIVVFPVCIAFVTTETFATKTPHIASFERASSTAAVFDMKLGPLNFEYPDSGQIQSVSVNRRQREALLEHLEVGSELAKGNMRKWIRATNIFDSSASQVARLRISLTDVKYESGGKLVTSGGRLSLETAFLVETLDGDLVAGFKESVSVDGINQTKVGLTDLMTQALAVSVASFSHDVRGTIGGENDHLELRREISAQKQGSALDRVSARALDAFGTIFVGTGEALGAAASLAGSGLIELGKASTVQNSLSATTYEQRARQVAEQEAWARTKADLQNARSGSNGAGFHLSQFETIDCGGNLRISGYYKKTPQGESVYVPPVCPDRPEPASRTPQSSAQTVQDQTDGATGEKCTPYGQGGCSIR